MAAGHHRERSILRRAFAAWSRNRLRIFIVLGLVAAVFGWFGFSEQMAVENERATADEILYRVIGLFRGNGGGQPMNGALNVARWMASLITLYAVGATVFRVFRNEFAELKAGLWNRHVVVVGLGATGVRVAIRLHESGRRVIAFEVDRDNPNIARCRDHGITVLVGAGDRIEQLRRARVDRAAFLYALTGDDARNARISAAAHEIVEPEAENRILAATPGTREAQRIQERRDRQAPLVCFQRVDDPLLARLLAEYSLMRYSSGRFQLEALSPTARATSHLLAAHTPSAPGPAGAHPAHILVMGAGDMANEIVSQAGRRAYEDVRRGAAPIRISVLGCGAEALCAELQTRYPRLADACSLRPFEIDPAGPLFAQGTVLLDAHAESPITVAYVTADDDASAIRLAIRLREKFGRHGGPGAAVPIVACVQSPESPTANPLPGGGSETQDPYIGVVLFGVLERLAFDVDALTGGFIELLAREVHREYLETVAVLGESGPAVQPWETLPEKFRESSRRSAASIGPKLAAIDCMISPLFDWAAEPFEFTPDEIDVLARLEHDRWYHWNSALGVTRALQRGEAAGRHPDMVPYDELPASARQKDIDSVTAIPGLLHRIGFRILRRETAVFATAPAALAKGMERETGLEPATFSLEG